jgi:hypothetical protein
MTILVKSGSDILYHITNIRAAASVLTKDRFELKPSEGTASEQDIKGGTYYLSCMRSKVGAYMTRNLSSWSAVFVLNGQAFGKLQRGVRLRQRQRGFHYCDRAYYCMQLHRLFRDESQF